MSDLRGQKDARGVYTFRKPVSPLNKVASNNRFSNMDFDAIYRDGEPYEHQPYPRMIHIPIPPDDELPDALQRKTRDTQDSNGQVHTYVEPEKFWRKRVEREWPNYCPIAEDAEHEARLLKQYGMGPKAASAKASA